MPQDSKLFEQAYKAYKKSVSNQYKKKKRLSSYNRHPIKNSRNHWVKTTKEYYAWKKTQDFRQWKRHQFLKQGGLCWYCGDFLPMTRINVEHKTARSLGGTNKKSNLVLSCSGCNRKKGSSSLSRADREKYNKQNKNNKNTYQKNKQHYNNLYGDYQDKAIIDKLKHL